jgi:hypothetical protein
MKKVGGLVALLTCVTIGGVYAMWTFSETNNIVNTHQEVMVSLNPTIQTKGASGSYSVEKNFSIVIYQTAATDHTAKLMYVTPNTMNEIEPSLKITFTPTFDAPIEVRTNAVDTYYYFTTTVDMKFKCNATGYYDATNGMETSVFTFDVTETNYLTAGKVTWTSVPGTDGALSTFTFELKGDALKELINFGNFVLDDLEAYRAFESILTGNLLFHVTDNLEDIQHNTEQQHN